MKIEKAKILLAAALLAAASAAPSALADGGMKVFPITPFFTDSVRSQHVNVVNNSDRSATFRATLGFKKQGPDGSPIVLDGPPDPNVDLSKMLIYSPRQVFLQPGDVQSIKIALRRPEHFPEGEHRVYLKLMRMDENGPSITARPDGGKGLRAKIAMQVSYDIPVVVRHGTSDTTAKITEAKFTRASGNTPESLNIKIRRAGKFSSMGNVTAYWTPPGQEEKVAGKASNVNIFPENDLREVPVLLLEKNISGGTLRIVYEGSNDSPDKGVKFDERVIPVG